MRLDFNQIVVTSYETGSSAQFAAEACTTTLDSLVEHLCPDGLTVGCHDETTVA
ncbi:MAG TPA: hypothetical protein VFH27_02795 [Longimicrobiaceae bacterium]|nr:hypothetical protein [Longimicrobiaceae bacterium]